MSCACVRCTKARAGCESTRAVPCDRNPEGGADLISMENGGAHLNEGLDLAYDARDDTKVARVPGPPRVHERQSLFVVLNWIDCELAEQGRGRITGHLRELIFLCPEGGASSEYVLHALRLSRSGRIAL